jgi:hypothetical protein
LCPKWQINEILRSGNAGCPTTLFAEKSFFDWKINKKSLFDWEINKQSLFDGENQRKSLLG